MSEDSNRHACVIQSAQDPLPPAHQLSRWAWLGLIAYAGSLFLLHLGHTRTFTGHECYVVEAAKEMLATGDWLVPRIRGTPWLEKPPFPQWAVACTAMMTGRLDEFTARLPSAISALLGVLIVAGMATRWLGPTRGLFAGLILATSVYILTYSRLAEPDIYLWAVVMGCLAIFGRHITEPCAKSPWYGGQLAFYFLLGMTHLVKGPMFGMVIVLAPCLAFIAIQRNWSELKWFVHIPGLMLLTALAVGWPLAVLCCFPEAGELWLYHTIGRMDSGVCFNPEPPWYYFETLPWQVLPWTIIMLPAIPLVWKRAWRENQPVDRFVCLWLVVPFVLLSLIKAKHHHYLIYALPPCALWAAEGLILMRGKGLDWLQVRARRIALFCVAILATGGGVWWMGKTIPKYQQDCLILGSVILIGVSLMVSMSIRKKYVWAEVGLFATLWCGVAYLHGAIMPKTDRYREDTALFHRIEAQNTNHTPIFAFKFDPARMLLYVNSPIESFEFLGHLRDLHKKYPASCVLCYMSEEETLRRAGFEPVCIDGVPEPRWKIDGKASQLGFYRLNGNLPASVAKHEDSAVNRH